MPTQGFGRFATSTLGFSASPLAGLAMCSRLEPMGSVRLCSRQRV